MVIVKADINRMLLTLVGREELIPEWWNSMNIGLYGKTPNELYQSGDEGRQLVYNYVLTFYEGGSM